MYKLVFIVVALCAISACANAPSVVETQSAVAPEFQAMPHVKRANFIVSDIDRTLTIYHDILGLVPGDIQSSSEDSYSYTAFKIPAEATLRSVTLSEPREKRTFALTEVTGIDLPRPSSAPHMSTVVIGIDNLEGKFERIKALGLEVTEPRVAKGVDFRFIEQAFVDYDGHLVVCYEALE